MKKVIIWIKVGKIFIDEDSIRAVRRHGDQTMISLSDNNDLVVNASYEKVSELLPSGKFQL
jgi:hypothetical protein